ncbi:MAG: 2-amino-4-hydroxy-6-hydroxymethyldihydropteridine diphosphokinase [Planctomycetes bacterium]|nr:2-amino-4-hydroxy-6-hydroxymethyldihydropteridine diphosphokinase [Planctomycetota bacterium]
MPDPVIAYIALGSNLGDRRAMLDAAIERLRLQPGIEVLRVSSYHETEPVGGPAGQGKYLNAAAEVRTTLTAPQLLGVLQAIEAQLGRVRAERFGPRTIDLDVLYFGSEIICTPELMVPHPRLHERTFVLEPLVELAPAMVDPMRGSTIQDLLRELHRPQQPRRELAGQKAVIVGSSRGIGSAIAIALADAGADVFLHGRGMTEALARTSIECQYKDVKVHTLDGDLRKDLDCTHLISESWRRAHAVDIWVQCAGADILTGDAAMWPFDRKLEELWQVDVRAGMLMARYVGERMKKQGRGVILTMGWDQAETGMAGDSGQLFGAVKGAVMAFTKSLALELAPEVRVNCLAPGWIRTAWGEHASAAWQERVLAETPLARWGTPEDVAQVARWLVSPAAQFITGQIIRINGGAVRA